MLGMGRFLLDDAMKKYLIQRNVFKSFWSSHNCDVEFLLRTLQILFQREMGIDFENIGCMRA